MLIFVALAIGSFSHDTICTKQVYFWDEVPNTGIRVKQAARSARLAITLFGVEADSEHTHNVSNNPSLHRESDYNCPSTAAQSSTRKWGTVMDVGSLHGDTFGCRFHFQISLTNLELLLLHIYRFHFLCALASNCLTIYNGMCKHI